LLEVSPRSAWLNWLLLWKQCLLFLRKRGTCLAVQNTTVSRASRPRVSRASSPRPATTPVKSVPRLNTYKAGIHFFGMDSCFRRGDIGDFGFPQKELIRGRYGLRIRPVLIDLVLVKKIVLLDEPGYQTNRVEDYFNKVHIG